MRKRVYSPAREDGLELHGRTSPVEEVNRQQRIAGQGIMARRLVMNEWVGGEKEGGLRMNE